MSEYVEWRKERALPEYEQMLSFSLFTNEEVMGIKKAREAHEYRVTQPSREMKDFLEYLKYERKLIALTKERVKLAPAPCNHSITKLIGLRMKQLYTQALSQFYDDTRFWDEYIKFLHNFKFENDIAATFDRMLSFHGHNPEVWIRAILWEYNENYQDHRVKGLLLRAQQRHPESLPLYLTFFQIELENKRNAPVELALQHAEVVYMNGKKKCSKIEYFLGMLGIVDKFEYARPIQKLILDNLRDLFPHRELLWHSLAQRELNGLAHPDTHIDSNESIKQETQVDSKAGILKSVETSGATLKKRIERCVQIYDSSTKVVDTPAMWDYYIGAMLELNNDLTTQAQLKRMSLSRAFRSANEANRMSEIHFLQYIEVLFTQNPRDELIYEVLEKSTKVYPESRKMWTQYMRYYIQLGMFKKVREVFKRSRRHLGPLATDTWHLYIVYLKALQTPDSNTEFENVIKDLASQKVPALNNLKAEVLYLLATTMNLKKARLIYGIFTNCYPQCYEVYTMMSDLESKQLRRDTDFERGILEAMTRNFGETQSEVWLRYMKFERTVGEPKNVSHLYDQAISKLKPDLHDDFLSLHSLLINEIV